jgi:polysaccharide transporter, PST family
VTELGRKAAPSAAAMLMSQGCKFALQLGSVMLLGRLLRPGDFGLVAMVAPISAFIALFNELGLSQAAIQRPQVTQAQMSALFWVGVAFSVLLGLVTYLLSPLVGWFYGDPRTVPLMAAYGGLLIFSGLSAQHMALLNRRLRFGALAAVEVGALAAGTVAGVAVAWGTRSYWALIAMQGTTGIVTAVLAWALSGWRPQRPARAADVAPLLRFGGNLTGFNIVNFFARNLDNVLIGKVWGESSLGAYSQAYKLLMLPLSQISYPISRIAIPVLSRLTDEPERYRAAYLRMIEKVLLLAVPGVAVLVVLADKVVLLLLGPQWGEVVPIFHWLGVGGLVGLIGNSTGWLFISQDRTGEMFRWGVVGSTLVVISFLIGLPYGPVGVAAAYVLIGNLIHGPLLCWVATRKGPVGLADIGGMAVLFAAAAGASAAAVYMADRAMDVLAGAHPIAALIVCMPVSYAVSAGVLASLPAGRRALGDALAMAQLWRRPA